MKSSSPFRTTGSTAERPTASTSPTTPSFTVSTGIGTRPATTGGGFEENRYWEFTRDALLSSGGWGISSTGACRAIAADWIWERLSASDISALAPKYGSPTSYYPDVQTWRDNTTYLRMTAILRSLLFTGSNVDGGGDYASEYQSVSSYIEDYFAGALDLQGGVGATGAGYETGLQFDRAWMLEAFTVATGVDAWALSGKWAREWGPWIIYGKIPQRWKMEANQDELYGIGNDSYKNVALMAARAQDPYHQSITKNYWQEVQGRSVGHYQNTSLWCLVLWYDPTLPAYSASTSPKTVRLGAGGMDHIYMTTGLDDENATWAYFEAGKYFYGHQHQDAGAFTIHRKGNLTIDSGYYGQYRSTDGDDHASNYYHRSAAHNTVSIYDPNEPFYWGAAPASSGLLVNDGGQILPKSAPGVNQVLTDSTFQPGNIIAYEANGSYTYAQADLHNAYNQEALSESRSDIDFYPNKLTHITREFVFLRPDYFVVFDRVGSVDPDFVKVWNLHFDAEPVVVGTAVQRMGDSEAGIWDFAGANTAYVTDTRYGQGRLFMKSLLPHDRTIRKIGGRNRSQDGFAYWMGGFDGNGRYDPTEGENFYWGEWNEGKEYHEDYLPSVTIGWGRIEVEATTPAEDDLFLHVLYPCDNDVTEMPDTRLIESEGMVGAEIVNERVILFGREETSGIDSVSYRVAPEDTSSIHTICNLIPETAYRVFREGRTVYVRRSDMPAPQGAEEIVTPPPTATEAGLLSFGFSGENLFLQISNVTATYGGEGAFSVFVEWDTDMPADSRVEYGPGPSYGFFSDLDESPVTHHAVMLSEPDIANDVTYYYRVHSEAPGGQSGSSGGYQFHFDVIPPGPVSDLRTSP
ncbi:MAG: heparinase II/III family protein [Candidatus Eisenbacteria bacterium]